MGDEEEDNIVDQGEEGFLRLMQAQLENLRVYRHHRNVRFVPREKMQLPEVSGPGPAYPVWVSQQKACIHDAVIRGAVWAGGSPDIHGAVLGRCEFQSALVPACVYPNTRLAYFTWGGELRVSSTLEVLLVLRGDVAWVPAIGGDVPPYAFPAGYGPDGEEMFAARVRHKGVPMFGRVLPSEGVCLLAADNQEKAYMRYEVLAIR